MTVLDHDVVADQLKNAPTRNESVLSFVGRIAALTTPDEIVWIDGSDEQKNQIAAQLVEAGTIVRLNGTKDSYYAASDPEDVARVEGRTFICSEEEKDAGPLNNWVAPAEMKETLNGLFAGSMRGRSMYVIPFVMGHAEADQPMFGIEVTDSAYVVLSMLVMARSGKYALDAIDAQNANFVECVHSVGAPLEPGSGRCRLALQHHEVHHALPGRALDLVLRLRLRRQRPARQEVLRAAHRLGDRPRRGLAGRAHAHPQADEPGGRRQVRGRRVPVGLRQDQPRDDRADHSRLEGRDPR
jgi:GTP-dependent phosphoenolpyruvate carboxykinase